jgi:hypothetical protein
MGSSPTPPNPPMSAVQFHCEGYSLSPFPAAFLLTRGPAIPERYLAQNRLTTVGEVCNVPGHGRLAQLVRALASHARGHWFKSSIVHH